MPHGTRPERASPRASLATRPLLAGAVALALLSCDEEKRDDPPRFRSPGAQLDAHALGDSGGSAPSRNPRSSLGRGVFDDDAPSFIPPPWTDAWIRDQAKFYLDDAIFRRDVLERSLANHENLYSAARLSAYGHGDRGWDVLPTWVPTANPVTPAIVAQLRSGDAFALPPDATPIWDGKRPGSINQWLELGRRVFFDYPLRPEVFAEHALARPNVATATGLVETDDGQWPGLVAFRDIDGRNRIGITCALCHTAVEDGTLVIGRARRAFDYGQLRLAYHRDTAEPIPPDLAERMAHWGPGRADITEDDDEDPVAIPDLWGVRQQSALTQAGTILHVHPAALAIRQETQILHANRERSRPPRELAWALAMYVYSLEAPAKAEATADPRGAELFAEHCASCHDNAAHGGKPVSATQVGTNQTLAFGRARGTGRYRPSPLLRVADAAPYFHDGSLPSLEALLSPERLSDDYTEGVRGPGPIPGHEHGLELPEADREALLAYLRVL